ncbi:MAG: ABC transporter permease [Sedimentisphaerales bacterium]|nr:ABC transporter permease [Sedimentisphaerales bacterium]
MLTLALSNLMHRKIRSILSILAVAIAITLLLVLVGLSHGTLNEVSRRMESVDAEIVVRDKHFDLGSMSGGKLWEKEIPRLMKLQVNSPRQSTPNAMAAADSHNGQTNIGPAIQRVIPVFLGRMKLAGLSQNVFGVNPQDFPFFAGSRHLVDGVLFEDIESPAQAVQWFDIQAGRYSDTQPDQCSETQAAQSAGFLPLVIDQRLSRAANLRVGDTVGFGDIPALIVGIVETGVAGRVFAPVNMLRGANGIAARTAHLFFVKAQPNLTTDQLQQLCGKIERTTHRSATLVANYGQVLRENFRNLTVFVSLVSVIALVICFLFILVTIHTSVLERSKEIAILQSLGAGCGMILTQTIQEALLICSLGTVLGILLTFCVRWLIETYQPLMTVEVRLLWLLAAMAIGLIGGTISALYPGYIALRHDPVEALSFE